MSNVKRKDSKGRNLRLGESQRKDGRYVYKYTDMYGQPQFVYAWKLVPTDKTPAGKREDLSLREKQKKIKKDLDDGINTIGGKMTVCQLYAKCFLASNFPHFHRYDSLKSALYIHAVSKNINTFPKNQGRIRAAIAVKILDFTVMYR